MNRREILLDLRNRGKLKGLKPCFVNLRPNIGKIFNGVAGRFIMTIRDNTLYFQKLSFFLHRLIPGDDFSVNVNRFVEYKIEAFSDNELDKYFNKIKKKSLSSKKWI